MGSLPLQRKVLSELGGFGSLRDGTVSCGQAKSCKGKACQSAKGYRKCVGKVHGAGVGNNNTRRALVGKEASRYARRSIENVG